jgi:predicted trehalose synthase
LLLLLLLLRSLEYAAYATLQEKQKRNEKVTIRNVDRGTRF